MDILTPGDGVGEMKIVRLYGTGKRNTDELVVETVLLLNNVQAKYF